MVSPQIDETEVQTLLERGIAALKTGDKSTAFKALTQALQADSDNEGAWIWLSGVSMLDAERKFCMERALEINPHNEDARRGLEHFPADLVSRSPLPKRLRQAITEKGVCTYPGCTTPVSKPGHTLCYRHWKEANSKSAEKVEKPALLFATTLGEHFGLSSRKVNLILAELGWLSRERKGWVATEQGKALGAVQRDYYQTGVPFVLWHESILTNKALVETVKSFTGESAPTEISANQETEFREKFAPTHRATDGHWVRSKAEMLIDNWLYMSGIAHAYERRLPIEEEAYCDFYLPDGKVYIEYWGMEANPKYQARQKVKIELYQQHRFNLIQLSDEHIRNLDDHLPKMLLKFGVIVS